MYDHWLEMGLGLVAAESFILAPPIAPPEHIGQADGGSPWGHNPALEFDCADIGDDINNPYLLIVRTPKINYYSDTRTIIHGAFRL